MPPSSPKKKGRQTGKGGGAPTPPTNFLAPTLRTRLVHPVIQTMYIDSINKTAVEAKTPTPYPPIKLATIKLHDIVYIAYADKLEDDDDDEGIELDTTCYLGQCIHRDKNKDIIRIQFFACSTTSSIDSEFYNDFVQKDKELAFLLPPPPTSPAQPLPNTPVPDLKKFLAASTASLKSIEDMHTNITTILKTTNSIDKTTNTLQGSILAQQFQPITHSPPYQPNLPSSPTNPDPTREVIIYGVPHKQNEDLSKIIDTLLTHKNMPPSRTQCTSSRNISNQPSEKDTPPNITLRFNNPTDKTTFLKRLKDADPITVSTVLADIKDDATPIYINENLPTSTRQLFYLTRQEKTAKKYSFAWTRNGQIFIKTKPEEPATPINCAGDLQRLTNPGYVYTAEDKQQKNEQLLLRQPQSPPPSPLPLSSIPHPNNDPPSTKSTLTSKD